MRLERRRRHPKLPHRRREVSEASQLLRPLQHPQLEDSEPLDRLLLPRRQEEEEHSQHSATPTPSLPKPLHLSLPEPLPSEAEELSDRRRRRVRSELVDQSEEVQALSEPVESEEVPVLLEVVERPRRVRLVEAEEVRLFSLLLKLEEGMIRMKRRRRRWSPRSKRGSMNLLIWNPR